MNFNKLLILLATSLLVPTTLSQETIELNENNNIQNVMAVPDDLFEGEFLPGFLDYNHSIEILLGEEDQLREQLNFPHYSTSTISSGKITINLNVDYYDSFEELKHQKWVSALSDNQVLALQSLEYLADNENDPDAAFTLGQLYLFGNYSIPTNSDKSLHYFQKCVAIEVNPEAHYYLGFLYTTGLFGKLKADQSKSLLHFEIAAKNGNLKAAMCLAHRYFDGLYVPQNYDLAAYYYSLIAKDSNEWLAKGPIGAPNLDSYSIRISSFEKGMYGEDVSEASYTLTRASENNEMDKNHFNELNINPEDHWFVECYFDYRKFYYGDYLTPRDYDTAFKKVHQCADVGLMMPSVKRYLSSSQPEQTLDIIFIGKCALSVGHMYLRGEGVAKNYTEAFHWLQTAEQLFPSSEVYNDLGNIYEFGLGLEQPDIPMATHMYQVANKKGGSRANCNLGKLLIKTGTDVEKGWELVKQSAYYSYPEAMYFYAQAIEKGIRYAQMEDLAIIYKYFVEKIEPVVTNLDWAFKCLVNGDNENALLGYAMAAEQGYESAQSSAAYLLFPPVSYLDDSPKVPLDRYRSGINYYQRSSKQHNLDSAVFLGDLYFNGLENSTTIDDPSMKYVVKPDLEKAASIYQEAANYHSSQARFNLGYAYEMGLGVPKDFHLAKRYYDLVLDSKPEAYIPVQLSLFRLRLKLWWSKLLGLDGGASAQNDTAIEKRGWKDWLNLYKKLREREKQALSEEYHQHLQTNNDNTHANANADTNDNNADQNARTASETAYQKNFEFVADEELRTEDIIVTLLVFAAFAFTVFRRWRGRRPRRAGGEDDDNNNGDDENNNNNNNNNNDNNNGGFQFQFIFVPL